MKSLRAQAATRASLLLAAALALEACPPPPTPLDAGGCAVDGATVLQIGAGDPDNATNFHALNSGDTVHLTPGNQGGQHIWVQLEGRNLCPDHPALHLEVRRASDDMALGVNAYQGNSWSAVASQAGWYIDIPRAAQLDPDKYCLYLHGGHVRLYARVDDRMGHTAETSLDVVIDGWSPTARQEDRDDRDRCCADFTNTMCWPNGAPDAGASDSGDDVTGDDADAGGDDASAPLDAVTAE